MTIHLTYIVNRRKWQQKVHDISNFMVKYYYFFIIDIAELFHIYIFQVQNSLQCASASA